MPTIPGHRPPVLLELDLTELPVASEAGDPLTRLRTHGRAQWAPVLRALHEAAEDPRVVGLIAQVGAALPWAGMQELRLGVRAFASSGKPTVAWAQSFPQGSADMTCYVLATAFDEVWLQPGGTWGPLGVAVETTFVRGALDRLGIEPQIEQRHEYKNAADQMMRSEFTEAHRAALDALAESLFTQAVEMICSGRNLNPETTRRLVDTGARTADQALDAGLVDAVGYRDQAYAAVRTKARDGDRAQLLFADRWRPGRRAHLPRRRAGHVALVEVRGAIVSGASGRAPGITRAGSDSVSLALRQACADDDARAVVLRVDSPGGSAVASETIWREVCRVREAGKPVVVSMGGLAASGGYYIACPADVIVALPATLTGSIGVFGGKLVTRGLLDRLGLTTDRVAHGQRSLMFSARSGFTDDERAELSALLDTVYRDFVAKVAVGRHRCEAEIEQVARGRVWTGSAAVPIGLVDELGDLHHALRIARDRAGLGSDAPVRRAGHLPALRRMGRARNSEDPRAALSPALPAMAGVSDLWPRTAPALRMPQLDVR